jgi:hypothetical protein
MTFTVLFTSPTMVHLVIKYILSQDPSSIPDVSKGCGTVSLFVVEPDICVATITSGYLEACIIRWAYLCPLNQGLVLWWKTRFASYRLYFVTAATVNSDTIHFHWAGVPWNLFVSPPFPSVSGLHGRSSWPPSIPFHYLPCLCFSLLIYTLNIPSALW